MASKSPRMQHVEPLTSSCQAGSADTMQPAVVARTDQCAQMSDLCGRTSKASGLPSMKMQLAESLDRGVYLPSLRGDAIAASCCQRILAYPSFQQPWIPDQLLTGCGRTGKDCHSPLSSLQALLSHQGLVPKHVQCCQILAKHASRACGRAQGLQHSFPFPDRFTL